MKTNEEMLDAVRKDRPEQIINKVTKFRLNKYGFYDVKVDMEEDFFETKILYVHRILPYPISEYVKLSDKEQMQYRWNNLF